MNRIIILVGASGSGKTSVSYALERRGIQALISHTTRPMRPGECDGKDYHFVTEETLPPDFVEHTHYSGYTYGMTRSEVDRHLPDGHVVIVCERAGAAQIVAAYPEHVVYIWLDISENEMVRRMRQRGDNPDSIRTRMQHARDNGELVPPVCDTHPITILDVSAYSRPEMLAERVVDIAGIAI